MQSLKCVFVLLCGVVNLVSGYKVLAFFPYPSRSHTILGEGYVRHLLNAGHNVTYVTPRPLKPAPNLRQIDVSSNFQYFLLDMLDIKKLLNGELDLTNMAMSYGFQHQITEVILKHENVQKLFLDTSEEFDVVIVEWLHSELYSGISAIFNCPYIWSSSMEPHPLVMRLIDDYTNPSYIPDHMYPIEPPLTFTQRVRELWHLFHILYIKWKQSDLEKKTYEEAYGPAYAIRGRKMPSFEVVKYNGSLMLGNSHVAAGLALRLPQNYIPINGYHIKEEIPPLPENIKNIMDNATHGVIFFSLGSIMKGKTLPEEMKAGFLKMFSELKQVVIWKLEEDMPDLPKNVHILEWAPQSSILAHPNLILFITHGGLLSTTEALHFGVPLIGIPLFADQFINIQRTVNRGFGIHVPLVYDTPVLLKTAIQEFFDNIDRYQRRAKELSLVYHDRPLSPGKELVHWVEHVARTRGAPHLRSVALLVPWYQKMYLDLLALIVISIFIVTKLVRRLLPKRKTSAKKND